MRIHRVVGGEPNHKRKARMRVAPMQGHASAATARSKSAPEHWPERPPRLFGLEASLPVRDRGGLIVVDHEDCSRGAG